MFVFSSKKEQVPVEPTASQLKLLHQDNKEYVDASTNTPRPEPDYTVLFTRTSKKHQIFLDNLYTHLPHIVFFLAVAVVSRN